MNRQKNQPFINFYENGADSPEKNGCATLVL